MAEREHLDSPTSDGSVVDSMDEVIALYKRDVDRTLLRAQLRKTPEQRLIDHMRAQRLVDEVGRAGREAQRKAR